MAGAGNLSLVTLLTAPVAITLGALMLGEALPSRAFAGLRADRGGPAGDRRPPVCAAKSPREIPSARCYEAGDRREGAR